MRTVTSLSMTAQTSTLKQRLTLYLENGTSTQILGRRKTKVQQDGTLGRNQTWISTWEKRSSCRTGVRKPTKTMRETVRRKGPTEEEEEWDSTGSVEQLSALRDLFPLLQKGHKRLWGSEEELEYLRDDIPVGTTIQSWSPEPRDEPPSCFSCSDTSQMDPSENDSDHSSDDLSSGVFSSCNRHSDRLLEWRAADSQRSSCCFEGVDVWIENMQGQCLRIRESRQVNVGHVAVGISDQMWGKAFTLETLDRKLVSFQEEITVSNLWLCCVPAPDWCQRWRWRVRDGKLELRE
ncbi:Mitogen-activated protein kinase kinase kinase 14 [Oryzias melastigma]|uniref:Mitogen-activated protein kinase kinase kinase 14 n=1 Tax=Oryzias melastigma TaxID=30732 RepID=A0A834FBX8_ORYME|nr:Mitogen-activated protein kinase kinase kinase 14 [Oryzias melastigma]